MHSFESENIMIRKKKRLRGKLSDFLGTLKLMKVGDSGVSRTELEGLRADADRINMDFVKA